MSGNARRVTAAQRVLFLVLAAVLALVLGAGAATADPPAAPPPDAGNAPASVNPSSDYPVDLNGQIAAFKERVMLWQQRAQALEARAQSLKARIDAHNATVDSYPNRMAPPSIADSVNAEGATLRSEQQVLRSEMNAWMAESRALETERLELLQQIGFVLQNKYRIRPPTVRRTPSGDQASRPGRNSLGQYTKENGGDSESRKRERDALDMYAKARHVEVDKRQVAARLSPDSLSKFRPEERAKLKDFRKYDGLVREPDGHYKALEVKTAGTGLRDGQKPFDDAILRGGQATAVVDGKNIIIDEVEIVPG